MSEPASAITPGGSSSMAESWVLAGGVVAHNEEGNLGPALRSLLDQQLPTGVRWRTIWVVASGCTDRTVEVADRFAADDPRVRVVVEPERRGKAHALSQVLRRAQGDAVVLLNADARAAPGAIAALVRAAEGHPPPYAVMGRPVVPPEEDGPFVRTVRLLWSLHHEFHRELLDDQRGNHLSDELLLVSTRGTPELPEGVINDGSFLGAWLSSHGGERLYAPDARASIDVPTTLRDHLTQRRRIRVGNRQVESLLGVSPSTFPAYALGHPREALSMLRRALRGERHSWSEFILLVLAELAAGALEVWDRLPPRRDHVHWVRIHRPMPWAPSTGP